LREIRGPFRAVQEPVPCATRVDWNTFFIFLGEVAITHAKGITSLSNSPVSSYELLPIFQQGRLSN